MYTYLKYILNQSFSSFQRFHATSCDDWTSSKTSSKTIHVSKYLTSFGIFTVSSGTNRFVVLVGRLLGYMYMCTLYASRIFFRRNQTRKCKQQHDPEIFLSCKTTRSIYCAYPQNTHKLVRFTNHFGKMLCFIIQGIVLVVLWLVNTSSNYFNITLLNLHNYDVFPTSTFKIIHLCGTLT